MTGRVRVSVEAAPKKVFVAALDWPGWARAGRDEGLAVQAFLAAAPRYAVVAAWAGLPFETGSIELDVVERLPGGGTEFGIPSTIAEADREPVDATDAERLATIVEAAWVVFVRVAAAAPEELRNGPHGGGRDRARMVDNVNGADEACAREIGLTDRPRQITALRSAMLEILRTPSDGAPLAGRKWTQRYAARRIAWHALDHAWEIEDRTEPA